jgi:AraC-like DNA-binding protein
LKKDDTGGRYRRSVVLPAERDARGIIAPETALTKFSLNRHAPSPGVARFVSWYWVVTWDLRDAEPHEQQVFAHPVVNVVFGDGPALIHGVTTKIGSRLLEGEGRVIGIMFRPAGFRPFLDRPMNTITDRSVPLERAFGVDAASIDHAMHLAIGDEAELVRLADTFLAARVPSGEQRSEATTAIAERAAGDPTLRRVDRLAEESGLTVRQLQRRFADHVGVSPKALIRRYRLYEAAELVRAGADMDWAGLAAELGYSDQAHLTRDFSGAIGLSPERYARACRV